MSACTIWVCSWWRADLSWTQPRAITWIVNSGPSRTCVFNLWRLPRGHCQGSSSVCTPQCWTAVSSLRPSDCPCCVSGPGWPGVWMTSAPPIPPGRCRGPARRRSAAGSPGWGSRARTFASWPAERPWCSAGCRSSANRGKAMLCVQSQEHQNMQPFQRQPWHSKPFWFCAAESPSLCGECPGIRGFACSGQSQCRPTFEGKSHHVHGPKDHRWKQDVAYFLQWMAGCFLLGSPIRIQCSISFVGRGPLNTQQSKMRANKWAYCG